MGKIHCAFFCMFCFLYCSCKEERSRQSKEVRHMKGYLVGDGYMGLVGSRYMLFSSEEEYEEYLLNE